MRLSFAVLLLFSSHLLIGQNIKGKIFEEKSNKFIESAHVQIIKNSIGTISDKNGEFNLKFGLTIKKSDTIRVSIIGYHTKELTLFDLERNDFQVFLNRKVETIDEITIYAPKLKSKLECTIVTSMDVGVFAFGSAIVDGKIYIVGGDNSVSSQSVKEAWANTGNIFGATFEELQRELKKVRKYSRSKYNNKIQIYNIDTETWNIPTVKIENRAYHNVVAHESKLYILGGKTISKNGRFQYLSNTVEVFDIATGNIEVDKTNPHQAVNSASFKYDNKLIVMGGSIKIKNNGTKVYTNKSHIFDFGSGYWYDLPKMTKAKESNGAVVGDNLYIIGGFDDSPLSDLESFNLKTEKWKKEGDLFDAMSNPALTAQDSFIYIFDYNKLIIYNAISKIMKEYKLILPVSNARIHYYDNQLFVLGGYNKEQYSTIPSKEIYKIDLSELNNTKSKYE